MLRERPECAECFPSIAPYPESFHFKLTDVFPRSQCFAMNHMKRRLTVSWKAVPPLLYSSILTFAFPSSPKRRHQHRWWPASVLLNSVLYFSHRGFFTSCAHSLLKQYWELCWTLDPWGFSQTILDMDFMFRVCPHGVCWICPPVFSGVGLLLSTWRDQLTGSNELIKQCLFYPGFLRKEELTGLCYLLSVCSSVSFL